MKRKRKKIFFMRKSIKYFSEPFSNLDVNFNCSYNFRESISSILFGDNIDDCSLLITLLIKDDV